MIQVEASTQIARRPADVFDFLTEVENLPRWQAGVTEAKPLTPGAMRIGSQFSQKTRVGPWNLDTIGTVSELKTNERIAFQLKSTGPLNCEVNFDLQPAAGGTRLTLRGVAQLKGLWRLLRPLLANELQKETTTEVALMKQLLETSIPSTNVATV
jgi:uncharacterized protein YndB with AHSA1/START domain